MDTGQGQCMFSGYWALYIVQELPGRVTVTVVTVDSCWVTVGGFSVGVLTVGGRQSVVDSR